MEQLNANSLPIHQEVFLIFPKAFSKLPQPKGGFTLPGHKYTGPYNDLDSQVKFNSKTGEILEIYDKPTGATDAIAL